MKKKERRVANCSGRPGLAWPFSIIVSVTENHMKKMDVRCTCPWRVGCILGSECRPGSTRRRCRAVRTAAIA